MRDIVRLSINDAPLVRPILGGMNFRGPSWLLRTVIIAGTTATVLSLLVLYLDVSNRLEVWSDDTVMWVDTALCGVMLAEWFFLLAMAEHKWKFVWARWIDLVASLPLLLFFRPFRVIRLLRLLRLLRGIALIYKIMRPWESAINLTLLKTSATTAVILILVCSVAVMDLERDNPNLDSFGEAIWWAVVTATTVGYGDRYPLSTGGQFVAVILMVLGIGLIGTLAASLTAALTPKSEVTTNNDIIERINAMEQRLAQLIEARKNSS